MNKTLLWMGFSNSGQVDKYSHTQYILTEVFKHLTTHKTKIKVSARIRIISRYKTYFCLTSMVRWNFTFLAHINHIICSVCYTIKILFWTCTVRVSTIPNCCKYLTAGVLRTIFKLKTLFYDPTPSIIYGENLL